MVRYHKSKRPRRKRAKKKSAMVMAKRVGLKGFFHTKEMVRADFTIRCDADGIGIVNGYSTALLNQFPDSTAWDNLNQAVNYGGLWKLYKITGVRYQFYPIHTVSGAQEDLSAGGTITPQPLPQFWWKYAQNGTPNPSNNVGIIDMCPRVKQFSRPFSLYVRNPKVLDSVWKASDATASTAEAVAKSAMWFDPNVYADVQHYGLQFGLINAQPNQTYSIKCMKTVYFSLKQPQ